MTISQAAPTIDENGIHAPAFADILGYLKDQYRAIYGADAYLENDSQDGQFLGIFALQISNINAAIVATYNSMSPATALGEALSRNVRLNGICRAVASHSSASVRLIGVTGTTILNGFVGDDLERRWQLPTPIVIGVGGEVTATATCVELGEIIAPSGSISRILTPTRGWQSVSNPSAATLGNPVETDAQLRKRQAQSVAIPSRSLIEGITGAVASLAGVNRCRGYENASNTVDALGLPPHSIALVVSGGDATAIAETIFNTKSGGCYTAGNTVVELRDAADNLVMLRYYTPDVLLVSMVVSIRAYSGYSDATGAKIKNALADFINALKIGERVSANRLLVPAALYGASGAISYDVLSIDLVIAGNATHQIDLAFNQIAACSVANISIEVN